MNEIQEDTINFITNDLVPEVVYNRCFCEGGSREFIEFDSIVVEPLKIIEAKDYSEIYRGQLIIKFSEYKFDSYPKCYVADMGRYGRPVIVLEDLEAIGYLHYSQDFLDDDHLKLCLIEIAKIHAHGVELKKNKFEKFREFYAKIIEINSELINTPSLSNKKLEIAFGNIEKKINEMTICHGEFNNKHLVFLYDKCKPTAVKILGWNKIKHTSPIIDLKCILNNNLMTKTSENKIESIENIDCIEQYINFYYSAYTNELNK
ncbi:hypothetical protein PV327_003795 [Microctonus hyperodae]|uniref:CHK kinase-like domain-containing protein n=1 Tax=Microctonus hyperodae TaxID=165561 RepID=A0AA39G4Q0_MICHY|nr:hypothetical protein PV327_003795 [Microctonus hyperodae]